MRVKGKKENIDYVKTKQFFQERAGKYNEGNPYSVTMYQDNNQELVRKRNEVEIETLLPLLQLNKDSVVLDIACGIGRWADAIVEEIDCYLGIDFSNELIQLANSRNKKANFQYKVASVKQLKEVADLRRFNRVVAAGILAYLNDADVKHLFGTLNDFCQPGTIICLREPLGIDKRLTLKDFYSDELKTEYNAIYRSREEIEELFSEYLKEFNIIKKDYLFNEDKSLNNRKETAQYYYILKKN